MLARALTFLQALAALSVAARLRHGRRRRPALTADGGATGDVGSITVIIPARNEALRLPKCLAGLRDAPGVLEVLVVDDRSEDDTAAVAVAGGAQVLEGAPLRDGWVGKPWALQQGLEAARGDVVVCFDADARPDPALPRTLAAALRDSGADLISGGVRFVCDGASERLLHPALLTTLMVRFGALDAEDYDPPIHRIVANGQCVAIPRAAFLEAGGFTRAAPYMTDDVGLARAMAAQGQRVVFVDAKALIDVKMYESVQETWREWGRRSLGLPDVAPLHWRVLDAATVTLVQALPILRLVTRRTTWLDRVLLLQRVGLLGAAAPVYARRGLSFWLSPLADPAAAIVIILSVIAPLRTWRGRTYSRAGSVSSGPPGAQETAAR